MERGLSEGGRQTDRDRQRQRQEDGERECERERKNFIQFAKKMKIISLGCEHPVLD